MKNTKLSSELHGHSIIESVPHALWRTFRVSFIILFLAVVATGLICWSLGLRTLYEMGNALFYTTAVIAFITWNVYSGNQQIIRQQTNPLNPMNRAMPGSQSERTRRLWNDFMEGSASASTLGISAILCFLLGWLLVTLAK